MERAKTSWEGWVGGGAGVFWGGVDGGDTRETSRSVGFSGLKHEGVCPISSQATLSKYLIGAHCEDLVARSMGVDANVGT